MQALYQLSYIPKVSIVRDAAAASTAGECLGQRAALEGGNPDSAQPLTLLGGALRIVGVDEAAPLRREIVEQDGRRLILAVLLGTGELGDADAKLDVGVEGPRPQRVDSGDVERGLGLRGDPLDSEADECFAPVREGGRDRLNLGDEC